jgi:hypothetical protein
MPLGGAGATLVVPPPADVPGAWAGAPSIVRDGDRVVLAYRLRRPVGEGRGFANVIAVSTDGTSFRTVATVLKDRFDTDSLERPALVRTPQGRWRLYLSLATPGTKHWHVVLLEADELEGLADAPARSVLAGDAHRAVKDPVLLLHDGRWHLWASVHPLDDLEHTDRMTTDYATSDDGVSWTWRGTVLAGRTGEWDARGARLTSVSLVGADLLVTYDGRARSDQNWEEATGFATGTLQEDGTFGPLTAVAGEPQRSPHGGGGLRYLSALPLEDGRRRIYYEQTRADGAHELRSEVVREYSTNSVEFSVENG